MCAYIHIIYIRVHACVQCGVRVGVGVGLYNLQQQTALTCALNQSLAMYTTLDLDLAEYLATVSDG